MNKVEDGITSLRNIGHELKKVLYKIEILVITKGIFIDTRVDMMYVAHMNVYKEFTCKETKTKHSFIKVQHNEIMHQL
jgi:hypothetical protein